MKLLEFEAKYILKKYGIPIPNGELIQSPAKAGRIAREIGGSVVIKAQVPVSGRGKSGGILFGLGTTEVKDLTSRLFGSNVKGIPVTSVLIEEKIHIASEYYASVMIDRETRRYVIMASTSGGIDIEKIAQVTPGKVIRYDVNPLTGFRKKEARAFLAQSADFSDEDAKRFSQIIHTLYTIALDYDAELVEINPLAKTMAGEFIACDARTIIDDNALYRHPEFREKDTLRAEGTSAEKAARKEGLAYVELDGDIGIIGNGAGLMMTTLDLVQFFGGRPANFLDIGGGASEEVIRKAVTLVMARPKVRKILVNILGGVTRCDAVARGIIQALSESSVTKPLIVRMIGTNEEEGIQILHHAGIRTYDNMEEAIKGVVNI